PASMVDWTILQPASWTAVLGATVVNMVLGFLWYSPRMPTGKAWIAATKVQMPARGEPGPSMALLAMVLNSVLMAWGLSVAIQDSLSRADMILLALFFAVTLGLTATAGLYFFEKRPSVLFWIGGGYLVVGYLPMAVVVAVWPEPWP